MAPSPQLGNLPSGTMWKIESYGTLLYGGQEGEERVGKCAGPGAVALLVHMENGKEGGIMCQLRNQILLTSLVDMYSTN